eukprot:748256-Hanusia_phi.AAC.3
MDENFEKNTRKRVVVAQGQMEMVCRAVRMISCAGQDVKGRNQGETFISSHFRSRAEEMGVDSSRWPRHQSWLCLMRIVRLIFTDSIDWKRHVE